MDRLHAARFRKGLGFAVQPDLRCAARFADEMLSSGARRVPSKVSRGERQLSQDWQSAASSVSPK